MIVSPEQLRLMPFTEAVSKWYEHIKQPGVRRARTVEVHKHYIKHLMAFFEEMTLGQIAIHWTSVIEYQRKRKAEGHSISYINHETNFLGQLMKYADLWAPIEKHFRPLPEPAWTPPKVMTADEEDLFFKIVAQHPDPSVQFAYWVSSLSNQTSAIGMEVRLLKKDHVRLDMVPPLVSVLDGKNDWRPRQIPLNEEAVKQIKRILERAENLARKQGFAQLLPQHYVIPFRVARNHWDVTRPASPSFMSSAYRKIRKATGMHWVQPKLFRKQVVTRLFEQGVPDETIEAIAGWQGIKVKRYYSGRRMDAKFAALSAIAPKVKKQA